MVRQWVLIAARELGMSPTTEGGYDWKMSLTEMLDGFDGHEHNYEVYPLYHDAVWLAAASGISNSLTLVVSNGVHSSNWWYATEDPLHDPKVRRVSGPGTLENKLMMQPHQWRPESQFSFSVLAEGAAKIAAAGGHVVFGSHGEFPGLGSHWELWMLGSKMPPHEVLRSATLWGARSLGLANEIGSLEPGKLADLQILDANPLDQLRNTTTIRSVMKDGRLYDANTLDEIWPRHQQRGPQWWQIVRAPGEQ
jgi:hypothetical protein